MRVHKINGKSVLKCRCGYIKEMNEQEDIATTSKAVKSKTKSQKGEIEVIDDSVNTLPTKVEECPKCGNKKAVYWQVQTRSGDESMTTFFRCTKCRYTWREY